MKKVWIWVISIFTLLILIFIARLIIISTGFNNSHVIEPPICDENSELENASLVTKIIDGDTFVLDSGEKVRLLCVDTPEKGKEGYEEAEIFLSKLIMCRKVVLTPSTSGPDKDKYGRLLRWVYVANSTDVYTPIVDFDEDTNITHISGIYHILYFKNETVFVNKAILDQSYGELMIIPPETCNEIK
jgi:hypothetical protein